MVQNTNIVIPWRSAKDWWRDESFSYVSQHMEKYNPIIADDGSEIFSRSGSKNSGALLCTDEVVMFLDADTYIPHKQIDEAIELARQGYIVHPYTEYHSIGMIKTKEIFSGIALPSPMNSEWCITWATGGATVLPKDFFFSIGSFDEDFVDWGYEDAALLIMAQKSGMELRRIHGECYHLWHPRTPENEQILANAERYKKIYLGQE